jgi:alanyl-tRNA synthetase
VRTTAELREGYLAFFESNGHLRVPSASLVPRADDRSTLLTTAGMQPLMPYFLGRERPPAATLTSVQKSFRTPDIDEVGLDGHHLTFFEMLGNFSFGAYFKEGAIELAVEFVRERLKLDWERIWVSVHAGDEELGLGPDQVAIDIWERMGVPSVRIVQLPTSENFWSVGGPGPCGPDSEIYWDWGPEYGCGEPDCQPGCERCERFLEFWNLVFTEYELHANGTLTPLPQRNIDTGLGLERTAGIVQDVMSVFETDGYQAIMRWIATESGVAYGDSAAATKAHRVLADHGRGMTFLAGDGVRPSNEGRGYVLRRIIRRAVQHGLRLGMQAPFLSGLAATVVEQLGDVYPELREHRREIARVLSAEEARFAETLERGMGLFEEVAARGDVSGEDAFKLHDTYGFPLELTRELAHERGLAVDEERFAALMDEQRRRSRARAARDDVRVADFASRAGFKSEFVGYEKLDVLTQIGALEQLEGGLFLAKLRESPFYPEGGGQVSDRGFIENEQGGARAELEQAFRFEDDQALLLRGEGFQAGDRVRAVVPWDVRFRTMANHTATHLLHRALREVLGDHATQAGSAVRPDKLRFDFSHPQAMSAEERSRVEGIVNRTIFANLPVHTFVMPLEEARELGATMLFGEKYGRLVRVVEVPEFSRELCGGTHVRSTAEIGAFAIVSEGSVGSGVRRIEALTSGAAVELLQQRAAEAETLRGELEQARREARRQAGAQESGPEVVVAREQEASGVNVIVAEVKSVDAEGLLAVSDQLKQRHVPAAVFVGAVEDGRVHLVANFDRSLEQRGLDAVRIVREAAALVGGGGGGRASMARAGGKQPERLPEALAAAAAAIVAALG